MQPFTLTTQLSTKEYKKILLKGIYQKPLFIVITLLGVYFFTTIFLDAFKIIPFYSRLPVPAFVCGVLCFLTPWIVLFISLKQFKANPDFQKEIQYTFKESGITIQGEHFSHQLSWREIIDFKKINHFIILYHKKKFGYIVNCHNLSPEQIKFIKTKVIKG